MSNGNILISSARSGTNYFLSVFSKCFPDALVAKEIFRAGSDSLHILEKHLGLAQSDIVALAESAPDDLWRRIKSAGERDGRPVMAKIFYYHVPWPHGLWEEFRANDKIVHMVRRNVFDVFLSHKVASQTGKWQAFNDKDTEVKIEPLVIDETEFQAFLDKQVSHVERTRDYFANADYSEIFYEDIATSVEDAMQAIGAIYGGVEVSDAAISLKKQKTKSNSDLVANYDAVSHLDKDYF